MELNGSVLIPASVAQVWAALNDPQVLHHCIPGCEEVRQISANELHARVLLSLGPVRAQFVGKVFLTEVKPLVGYTLSFEGSGGSAGFAKGHSVVTLREVGATTELGYTAQASVAGKLGQLGGRLIDASAAQLSAQFFANLKAHFAPAASPVNAAEISQAPASIPTSNQQEWSRLIWFAAGVLATALGVWLGSHLGK
jgi:uncharacterized protein